MHLPLLLNAGNDFNANTVLRNQPIRINSVPGAIEVQNYLELIEWLQATGDPISFAPHLKLSPLMGVPEKRSLFQIARGDKTVPNPTNSNLIRKAGGQGAVLYRHDIARANSLDSTTILTPSWSISVRARASCCALGARSIADPRIGWEYIPDANSWPLARL
ncbi:MAG: hypothetical protein WKF37_20510 [Bryobacteraceae bacterium]